MNVINTFHTDKAEEGRLKQRSIARGISIVQREDQPRVTKVGQSSKPKHVAFEDVDRKSTRLNSSHLTASRMPSSA